MSFLGGLFGAGVGVPSIILSIAPTSQSASGFSSSWNFSATVVTVTGGSPSAIVWSFENVALGSWSVLSGQGTLSAQARVTGVPVGEASEADFVCTVTIGGLPYRVVCPHVFFNAS
jgi:hypothetical protein